jgi:phosphatidate phosphatase APP1
MGVSDYVKGAADSALSKISTTVRSSATAQKVAEAEDWLNEQRMTRKLGKEAFRGTRVVVYRGYVTGTKAKVVLQVAESPRVPEEPSNLPYADVVKANIRRHWALALPGVQVRVEVAGREEFVTTDRHGFAAVTVEVPAELAPGWHQVLARTVPHRDDIIEEVERTGMVVKPHPNAPLAVISDIDDTVIRSGLTEGLSAVSRTLLGDQNSRRAIPGVSSWYRGLQRLGTVNGVEPPFFYVSTGSWSFYEMLTQFLQLRGFPRGPLFLTDWGPTDRYLHRSGAMHKRHTIGRIMLAYPDTPFVFVGDTGQGDADAYIDAARRFGRQVKLVVLLPAGDEERLAHVQGLAEAARAEGLPVHVVAGAQEAAELSLQLGLVDALALEEVRTELGAVF